MGEKANQPKVMIAIPIYGEMPCEAAISMAELVSAKPLSFQCVAEKGDSLVTRARNTLSAKFLASDFEKLLFIDSDLIYTPTDVERIASYDEDIVGGFYPLKRDGEFIQWCVNGPVGAAQAQPDERGLAEVRYIGTGFMCIRRRVFEMMILKGVAQPFFTDESHRLHYDFWSVGIYQYPNGNRRYLSEDWMFCQRWLDLGGKVFGDTQVTLRHVGRATWPLKHQKTGEEAAGNSAVRGGA